MIPKLIVWHHLGLGDHFICNGLVHDLLDKASVIWLACKSRNVTTVKHLYIDHPRIQVLDVGDLDGDHEIISLYKYSIRHNVPLLKIGYNGSGDNNFNESFYNCLGIDFSKRWSLFKLPLNDTTAHEFYNTLIENKNEPYALVNNSGSVGEFDLKINTNLKIYSITPKLTPSMLDWKYVVEHAAEIHSIDSSFIHFADSLNLNSNLYYHDVNRGSKFVLKHNWETVKY